ncbi:MAG: glycosyltransferase, partial [Candidatus Portnoybacteria bacterium]|nr:glycosyltransferase [Candidatus Portnoybacteria bacterium]
MLKNEPKVSIIMSVYNGERYLRDAIESILNQSFKDFEFIIINDGSRDSSKKIVQSYKDPRIVFIENKKNIGLTKSLNKGIKLARGEYVARMDADDISAYNRIEKQVNFLDKNKDYCLVGTTFYYIDENNKVIFKKIVPLTNKEIKKGLVKKNCFAHGSVMIRKKILEKVKGYREEIKYSQDYDLFIRIAKKCKVRNLKDVLYKWRMHKESISMRKHKAQKDYVKLINKKKPLEESEKEESKKEIESRMANNYKKYGLEFLRKAIKESDKNKYYIAREHFKKSLKMKSKSLISWSLLFISYLPFKTISCIVFIIKKIRKNFFGEKKHLPKKYLIIILVLIFLLSLFVRFLPIIHKGYSFN